MMLRSFLLGLAMVLTVACLPALAQRGGGGFGGGFGGRGPGGGGGSPVMLLGNEAVQKELGLSEDQISKLSSLREEVGEKMRESFGGFAGLRDLPEAEREAKMAEMREKMAENQKKMAEFVKPKLESILTTEQNERLQQIQWQAAGSSALSDEALAKALNLSAEQQEKLKTIATEAREKMTALGGGRGGPGGAGNREGFEERATKMREITEESQKAAMEVLTTEQKEQLAKLKGKEFDVAQLRGGFGGGRGGPGGRPGGQGGDRPARPE